MANVDQNEEFWTDETVLSGNTLYALLQTDAGIQGVTYYHWDVDTVETACVTTPTN